MDEFRRQLEQIVARLREWTRDLMSRFGGAAQDARRGVSERRASRRDAAAALDDDAEKSKRDERAASRRAREFGSEAAVVVATSDDDVASVVGRIDTADSPEVVLVVRRDAKALRRPTAWPHIAAYVRRRGIQLGVVAPRGDVRAHARTNGLRAARSPRGLRPRTEYLNIGGRRFEVPPVPWGRIIQGAMILVAFSTIFFMACYRVPSARITIVPPSEEVTAQGVANANPLIDESDLESLSVMATTVRRQVFTAVTTTTTGQVEVGDLRAVLQVTFANASGNVVQVPRGTRLLTEDDISFLTDENLDVPPQSQATVAATAEFPGLPGNIAAGTLTRIQGEVPPEITIAGSTAGTGGTNRLTAGVSQADVDRVRAIADDVLDGIALRTLQATVEEEGVGLLLPSTVSAAIFSEQPVQQLDQPSDIFVVEYEITASGLVVENEAAAAYGEQLIREQLPSGMALIPGSVTAEVEPVGEDGEVQVSATGRAATLRDITAAASEVTGMRPGEAKALLQEQLDLAEPPEVEISPNFVPWIWLPRRAESIEVVIGAPASEEPAEDAESEEGEDGEAEETETPTESPTETPTEPVAAGG